MNNDGVEQPTSCAWSGAWPWREIFDWFSPLFDCFAAVLRLIWVYFDETGRATQSSAAIAARLRSPAGHRRTWSVDKEIYIINDDFCIKNDEFCIKNDEFCISQPGSYPTCLPDLPGLVQQPTEAATEAQWGAAAWSPGVSIKSRIRSIDPSFPSTISARNPPLNHASLGWIWIYSAVGCAAGGVRGARGGWGYAPAVINRSIDP